ncbi:MAG: sigma-70 family RNA polymerase sigma factor [Chloroflexi bacterium]|nr:sigma-70 family RNA polymerase sigma factor [Chloroflexota bacterium]
MTATTFERALRSLRTYRGSGGGLGAWLLRIARNAHLNERRRSVRLTHLDAAMDVPGPGDGGDRAVELLLLVARLPNATRDAIALRYTAGLTAAEIGRVLGKSPDAVQKLIERGLDSLKEALHDDR